jgi:hypothetical protein
MDSPTWPKIVVPAIILAVGGIIAAVISAPSGSSATATAAPSAINSQGSPTPTTVPDSSAGSPGPLGSPSSLPSIPSSPSVAPKPPSIKTPQNQSGYTAMWHGTLTIGLPGIVFTRSGPPQPGDGSTYDIQYQGPGGGWNNRGPFYYWTSPATPGPASCQALAYAPNGVSVGNNVTAYVGDKYCFLPPEGGMIMYMQVTKIDASGVVLTAWLWSQNSWVS